MGVIVLVLIIILYGAKSLSMLCWFDIVRLVSQIEISQTISVMGALSIQDISILHFLILSIVLNIVQLVSQSL